MKKYTSVIRMGHQDTEGVVKTGDYITVYEKLDGANASFTLDGDVVAAFSRNNRLNEDNTLRGFYGFTRNIDPQQLTSGLTYYGEWLVRHKVDYGENEAIFYLFDIYDEADHTYKSTDFVIAEAQRLRLAIAPILYAGPYVSFAHLQALVGRSALASTADGGEGIVIKNVSFRDKYGRQTFTKMVSDSFREMRPQKAPRNPELTTLEADFADTFVTEGRVDKLLRKLVDEEIIPEGFGLTEMGVILRELSGRVYSDVVKEEAESITSDFEERRLRKAIGRMLPLVVRGIITKEAA